MNVTEGGGERKKKTKQDQVRNRHRKLRGGLKSKGGERGNGGGLVSSFKRKVEHERDSKSKRKRTESRVLPCIARGQIFWPSHFGIIEESSGRKGKKNWRGGKTEATHYQKP